MLPRFYAPDLDVANEFALPEDEAHHLTRVLRLRAGDHVVAFDGRGAQVEAVVLDAAKSRVTLRPIRRQAAPPAPAVEIVVVQAVLKGSAMDDAVRDATMMGAVAIEPVLTSHVDVKASVATKPETVERWRRVALASVKQCRRATVPALHHTRAFEDWLAQPSARAKLLFAEPAVAGERRPLKSLLEHRVPAHAAVILGPEGGWAADEIDRAVAAGCTILSLGDLTLRAESMPVAALAALHAIWQA